MVERSCEKDDRRAPHRRTIISQDQADTISNVDVPSQKQITSQDEADTISNVDELRQKMSNPGQQNTASDHVKVGSHRHSNRNGSDSSSNSNQGRRPTKHLNAAGE